MILQDLQRLLFGRTKKATPGPFDDFWYGPTVRESASGVEVNENTALNCIDVLACIKVIAETVASLPLHTYRRRADGGKEMATTHRLYSLLHDAPNTEMSSFQWRETSQCHLLTWGNAYSEIEQDGAGNPVGLWPLAPWRVTPRRDVTTLEVVYDLRLNEGVTTLPRDRILHLKGLSGNGLVGYSPVQQAKDSIGLSKSLEDFASRFFSNGSHVGVIARHPSHLTDEAHKRLQRSLKAATSGLGRAHRLLLLEEGMEWEQLGVPPEQAQFLESRRFALQTICRLFRIPPHMVAELERATFSNIEHQSIDFVVHCIRPWLVRWEQELMRSLFMKRTAATGRPAAQYFAEFNVDGLLRGDHKSRNEAYDIAHRNGWLCADEIRAFENMNPLPDGQGKVYLLPLNMVPADQILSPPQPRLPAPADKVPVDGQPAPQDQVVEPAPKRGFAMFRHEIPGLRKGGGDASAEA